MGLVECASSVALSLPAWYAVCVLFGAPVFSEFTSTAVLSVLLTVLTVLPLAAVASNTDHLVRIVLDGGPSRGELRARLVAFGAIVGCWLSSAVIPLDWDTWWQRYPLPQLVGCVSGACAGVAAAQLAIWIGKRGRKELMDESESLPPALPRNAEGIFGDFKYTDVPKLRAILFAEFHLTQGNVLNYQVPDALFDKKRFGSFSGALVPKPEMCFRLIKINLNDYKVIGYPVVLDDDSYERGKRWFNMAFVVPKESTVDCMYEPLVQKCAEYLIELEQMSYSRKGEPTFLANPRTREIIPSIMQGIFDGLNNNGECVLPVNEYTTMYLKLCPAYRGVEPPKVSLYMVPMLTRQINLTPVLIDKMDVLSQKIIAEIDGVRCVKEIAGRVQIDPDLVSRCIRNLHFYESVSLVPLFLYSNTYVATEKLHHFYHNDDEIKACLDFVRLPGCQPPAFSDVFRLYLSLKCGESLLEWCERWQPKRLGVDEHRLVQFGMHNKFLRKLSVYPVSTASETERAGSKILQLCDGMNALEDLAVVYGLPPEKLLRLLQQSDKQFEFISKG